MKFFSTIIMLLFMTVAISANILAADSRQVKFSQFSLILPPEWDGEEQTGFVTNNPDEYSLTLGRKDAEGDNFAAQVTIYLLPNRPGMDSRTAANTLTEAQGDATEPALIDNFWVFEGEPRNRTLKGRAITRVNTDKDFMLIIISQDPENLGASDIVASLKGESPVAAKLLGR